MNLYEKIGRLIKQHKLFDLSNDSELNSSSKSENPLGLEFETIESILSDILSSNKFDIQSRNSNYISHNKIFSKSDYEEAQSLIKKCSQDEQLILIAILEIQLSLVGNENNYIKYEKINEKIIEKNIYWVITCEIHKRVHKENSDFEEYCHCVKDQREKYILGNEYNFKYDNLDSIICKLKNTNKNIEFIALKSIFISLYNLSYEYVKKYEEIAELNKDNKSDYYLIFEYIMTDYLYIIDKIKFLNFDFKQNLYDFIRTYHINFTFENLFKDIFFNSIFHNQILGFQYIHTFIHIDAFKKSLLVKILNIVSGIKFPLCKNLGKILGIEDLISFRKDLASKIMEQNEQTHVCVGVGKCEIKKDEDKGEILRKKEIIYIRGKIDKKDNDEEKFDFSENNTKIKMEKIFIDLDKEDNSSIIGEKIIINKINKRKIENAVEKEKEKDNNTISENKENKIQDERDIINEITSNKSHIIEEINNIEINKVDSRSININDSINNLEKNNNKDNGDVNMENKSLDEIYQYINGDRKVKNKKKNRRRNKGKLKKNKYKNDNNNNESINVDNEDPIFEQFKKDITENFIFAGSITKIKPSISEEWLKSISSY